MELVLALGIYFAIWVVVIWGANYFNKMTTRFSQLGRSISNRQCEMTTICVTRPAPARG